MSYISETIQNLRHSGPLIISASSCGFICLLLAILVVVLRKPWKTALTMLSVSVTFLVATLLSQALEWFSIGRSPVEGRAEGWMVNQAMGLFLQSMDVLLLILTVNTFCLGIFSTAAAWFRPPPKSTWFLLFCAVFCLVLCATLELIRFRIRVLIAL